MPLVRFAEWKLKIRMASLYVEACARLPQNHLRTCPNILVMTHWFSFLDDHNFVRGAIYNSTLPTPSIIVHHSRTIC
ncbi:MAG TPA: hypothetical protein VJR48_00975, partial [Ktedonobacterales bacterium]|nr:hypothetical protein [Ktedonobacterales bacterium]